MSLWQGEWKMVSLDSQDRWLIAFMDDSSRLITCNGVFDRPTTEYTIHILEQRFQEYGVPRGNPNRQRFTICFIMKSGDC